MPKNKSSGSKGGTSAKALVVLALKGGKRQATEKPKAGSSAQKAKAPRTPSLLTAPRRSR